MLGTRAGVRVRYRAVDLPHCMYRCDTSLRLLLYFVLGLTALTLLCGAVSDRGLRVCHVREECYKLACCGSVFAAVSVQTAQPSRRHRSSTHDGAKAHHHHRHRHSSPSSSAPSLPYIPSPCSHLVLRLVLRRREIAPTHFPGTDGSYYRFLEEGLGNTVCCTGTPPKQLDRNLVGPSLVFVGVFTWLLLA